MRDLIYILGGLTTIAFDYSNLFLARVHSFMSLSGLEVADSLLGALLKIGELGVAYVTIIHFIKKNDKKGKETED